MIGGGYAGVMAANRLTRRDDVTVTLINPRPRFVERIRLHQLAGGTGDAVVDYPDVLARRVTLRVGSVSRIDAPARRLTLDDNTTINYDFLVYAAGSGSRPDVPSSAFPIASYEQARRLREALRPGMPVVVAGAGPTGIETAAELAEQGHPVTLACGGVLGPYLHPRGRRAAARQLAALGVTVEDGPGSVVTGVTGDGATLAGGRHLPGLTVWTAGFGVPDLAARSGLRTDPAGRLLTDETLTSVDDDRIVAAGDAASPSGRPLRMSCQAAGPLGAHAADTVLARIAGRPPAPVTIGFLGQCLSFGRRAGMFQFSHRDDTARAAHIAGVPGAKLKELVCWGTVKQLAMEARRPGTFFVPSWMAGRRGPAGDRLQQPAGRP
ncbi:NADH dehydrogenase [Actinoplanes sp. NBRC 103695]|nr:NADH dehydrogenase [Actinoplanes sp. NBRC 103695]